jgi:type VI secretion system protein ImpA
MAATLDLDRLLAPLSEGEPSGVSLRYDGAYERIREARREDDPSLPQGVWERSLKLADYPATAALCVDALARRSKDLQIAAWLADAWAELHGLSGIERGAALIAGLCDRFWDTMFPELDEDNDGRTRILEWLDEALSRRVHSAALGGSPGVVTLGDWDRADGRPRVGEDAAPTREGLLARMSMVGAARWSAVIDEVRAARGSIAALESCLAARESDPTRLRRTESALGSLENLVEQVLRMSGASTERRPTEAGAAPPEHRALAGVSGPAGAFITSRAEAYSRLTEAADYLLRTEPHSPVPYLVKRAIGWGNMSLAELLQEFVSGADDLVLVQRLLGMRRRDE